MARSEPCASLCRADGTLIVQELEEALREKGKELKDVKTRREDLGVELYGVQQQLAKLQMTLEKAHEEYAEINRVRLQVCNRPEGHSGAPRNFELPLHEDLQKRGLAGHVFRNLDPVS